MWQWKSSRSRLDGDPAAWTNYDAKTCKLIEKNYLRSTAPYVTIGGGRRVVYADPVHGTAQYQTSDPLVWRPVRRMGPLPPREPPGHLQMRVIGLRYSPHYKVTHPVWGDEYKTDDLDSDVEWSDVDHSVSATSERTAASVGSDPDWSPSESSSDESRGSRKARKKAVRRPSRRRKVSAKKDTVRTVRKKKTTTKYD